MKTQIHRSIIALLALIISAPAMLCVFAPGTITGNFSAHMKAGISPAAAHQEAPIAGSKSDPHAHHKMQHAKKADEKNRQITTSLACLLHCLESADNPYLTATAPEAPAVQLADLKQFYTTSSPALAVNPELAMLRATGPPPPIFRQARSARALLIEKSRRLRL